MNKNKGYLDFVVSGKSEIHPTTRVYCNDGEHVSIQVGEYNYCSPRSNYGPYYAVEAGFPSCTPPDSWREYAEEWNTNKNGARRLFRPWNIKYEISKAIEYKSLRMFTNHLRRAWQSFTSKPGTDTVFAWLPVDTAAEFIKAHGGEDTERCWDEYNAAVLAKTKEMK